MFVTLKDGSTECITNESDIANIVERYCGTEIADVIRSSEYTKLVGNCIEANNTLAKVYLEVEMPDEVENCIEDAMLLLEEVV